MSKKTAHKKSNQIRKESPSIKFEHTSKNLTSYAGLIPVIKFMHQLGFENIFNLVVNYKRGDNAQYQLLDVMLLLITGIIGGATSVTKCVALWADVVLRKAGGWLRIPDATTLGKILKGLSERHVHQLEKLVHTIRATVWKKSLRSGNIEVGLCTQWVDVDSSVVTVYGTQEGAAKGYNPHKRGALSYNPLLAFSTATKEILQGWFRTGNAYTSNGVVEFTKQLLANLPAHWRIIFRGDSGFFVGALLELLDQFGHGYLIKVKMRNLEGLLMKQKWYPIRNQKGWEQCEFQHQAAGWSCSRIFVAVRRRITDEGAGIADLFSGDQESCRYEYFCYVSSEPLNPWDTHKTYGKRATSETWIEEAKNQMGLAQIRTDDFVANAALFQAAILAYNTVRWMALLSGNKQLFRWEPASIRIFMIRAAGKLVIVSNQLRLKLQREHLYSEPWKAWLALAD